MKIGYLLFHSWKCRFSEGASIDKKKTPVRFDCEEAIGNHCEMQTIQLLVLFTIISVLNQQSLSYFSAFEIEWVSDLRTEEGTEEE